MVTYLETKNGLDLIQKSSVGLTNLQREKLFNIRIFVLKGYQHAKRGAMLKNTVRKLITINIILLSLIMLPRLHFGAIMLDRIIAVIGKEVITWSELYKAMEFDLGDQLRGVDGTERIEFLKKYEKDFLEIMIEKKLQLTYAEKQGIHVLEEEIRSAMEEISQKYSLTKEGFENALKQEGFTLEEYKKMLGEQIILSKVVNMEIKSKIIVSEEEIAEYLEKNKNVPLKPMEYRIRQIFLVKKDKDIQALRKRAKEVSERVKNGEDFRELASLYSDDFTAQSGGDLGFVKEDEMDIKLLERVKEMNEGEISEPFMTERGAHIIQLLEKKGAKTEKELRDEVHKKLLDERFRKSYKSWIKSLKEKVFIEVLL